MLSPGLTIDSDLLFEFWYGLTEHMGQEISPHDTCLPKGFGIASGGNPDGQFRLDRAGENADRHFGADAISKRHRLTSPEFAHDFKILKEQFSPSRIAFWPEHKVIGMPARGNGEANSSL
jgi:hypothetical protein